MSAPSVKTRMVSGVLWLAGTKALSQAITWVITILVVRLLAPQDYGLMGMAALFTGFLLLFNDLGLGAAIIQDPKLDDERAAHLRSAIFCINFLLFAVVLLTAPLVATYFREPALVPLIRTLSLAFVINGVGAPSGFMLARQLDFKRKSRAELFGNLSGSVTMLTLAVQGFAVWSLALGYLVQQFTTNTLYCVYQPIRIRRFPFREVRQSMHFGAQVAASSTLWYISSNADNTVVGRVLGSVQLGFYSLAFQFSSLPIEKIVGVVTQVAFPSFSAIQNDDTTLRRYYLKLVGTIALVTFPMFIGLLLCADTAVRLFLTAKWLPAVLPLQLLCLIACLRAIEPMNTPLALAKGRPRIILLNSLLQSIAMPIAFYAGTRFGVVGVAAAWVLVWPFLFALITTQTLRLLDMRVRSYLAELKHPVLGCGVMAMAVLLVQRYIATAPTLASLVISAGTGALVYGAYNVAFNRTRLADGWALARRQDAATTVMTAEPEDGTVKPFALQPTATDIASAR